MDKEMNAFCEDLLESAKQMKEKKAARKTVVVVSDITRARNKVNMSQPAFAKVDGRFCPAHYRHGNRENAIRPVQPKRFSVSPKHIRKYCGNWQGTDQRGMQWKSGMRLSGSFDIKTAYMTVFWVRQREGINLGHRRSRTSPLPQIQFIIKC